MRAYIRFWLAGLVAAVLFVRRQWAAWLALAVAGTLAACGGGSHSSSSAAAAGPTGTIALYAGSPSLTGSRDGWGVAASRMDAPSAVVTDGHGDFFVSDTNNNTIRWFVNTSNGWMLKTLAGVAGQSGTQDGAGTQALFSSPGGLVINAAGTTLFVADTANNTIRQIVFTLNVSALTSTATVSTYAGSGGISGAVDAAGTAARFNAPTGLAIDSSGVLYVADTGNSTIRKIDATAAVTTLAGIHGTTGSANGIGILATFNLPQGLALDTLNHLFVADSGNSVIREVDVTTAAVSTFAGAVGVTGSNDGQGTAATFNGPHGIAVDGGNNLYVSDTGNDVIRRIDTAGNVLLFAGHLTAPTGGSPAFPDPGSQDNTNGANTAFNTPEGLVFDSGTNAVYVADTGNSTIRQAGVTTASGGVVTVGAVVTLVGSAGLPGSVDGTGSAALFGGLEGMVQDNAGDIFVVDSLAGTVREILKSGQVITIAGIPGITGSTDGPGGNATFNAPYGIAIDESQGSPILYVSDTSNDEIRRLTTSNGGASWNVDTLAGSLQLQSSPSSGSTLEPFPGSADGTGPTAEFNNPEGIVVDVATRNIYVADSLNNTIRMITPTGVVSTYAGLAGPSGSINSSPQSSFFDSPAGLAAVDVTSSSGTQVYLYVADLGNDTIRLITPTQVSTIAGITGKAGSTDGVGTVATFNAPQGVVLDGKGNIYVTDTSNNTVRKIDTSNNVTTVVGQAGKVGFASGNLPGLLSSPVGLIYYQSPATQAAGLYVTSSSAVGVVALP